jgi:hypothetical protein
MGTCNALDSVCPSLRRGDRFDAELEVSIHSTDRIDLLMQSLSGIVISLKQTGKLTVVESHLFPQLLLLAKRTADKTGK